MPDRPDIRQDEPGPVGPARRRTAAVLSARLREAYLAYAAVPLPDDLMRLVDGLAQSMAQPDA